MQHLFTFSHFLCDAGVFILVRLISFIRLWFNFLWKRQSNFKCHAEIVERLYCENRAGQPDVLEFNSFFLAVYFGYHVCKKGVLKNFTKRVGDFNNAETPTQVFSCEFWEIFKSIYLKEHLRTAASVNRGGLISWLTVVYRLQMSLHFLPKQLPGGVL